MKLFLPSCVGVALCSCLFVSSQAQEAQSEGGGTSGGVSVIQFSGDGGLSSSLVIAQDVVGGSGGAPMPVRVMSPAGSSWSGVPDITGLIYNPQIRSEVGLIDDQWKEIQQIQKEYSQAVSEQSRSFRSGGGYDATKAAEFRKVMDESRAKMKERIQEVLLPHQRSRLDEIGYQYEVRNLTAGEALVYGRLAGALDISEEQKERISEKAEELEQELEEKIKRLKQEAHEELLSELTPSQRKKFEELVGEQFEVDRPDYAKQMREQRRRAREAAAAKKEAEETDK